jgi:hypothetical protein
MATGSMQWLNDSAGNPLAVWIPGKGWVQPQNASYEVGRKLSGTNFALDPEGGKSLTNQFYERGRDAQLAATKQYNLGSVGSTSDPFARHVTSVDGLDLSGLTEQQKAIFNPDSNWGNSGYDIWGSGTDPNVSRPSPVYKNKVIDRGAFDDDPLAGLLFAAATAAVGGMAGGALMGAGEAAGAAGAGVGESVSGLYGPTAGELGGYASTYGAGGGMDLTNILEEVGNFTGGDTGGIDWSQYTDYGPGNTGFGEGDALDFSKSDLGQLPTDLLDKLPPGLKELVSKLVSSGAGGKSIAGKLLESLGIDPTGVIGQGLSLAARSAPGLMALQYAKSQPGIDTSALEGIFGKSTNPLAPIDMSGLNAIQSRAVQPLPGIDMSGLTSLQDRAGQPLPGIDRSGLESTLAQLQGNQNAVIKAATDPAQRNIAAGYGDLVQSQGVRGIRGSSFGDTAISDFLARGGDTLANAGAQAAERSLGLQSQVSGQLANLGVSENAQRLQQMGLSGDIASKIAGLGISQNAQQLQQMGLSGDIASKIANLGLGQNAQQLQQTSQQAEIAKQIAELRAKAQATKNSLYGRAFDVLGRGINPGGFGGQLTLAGP